MDRINFERARLLQIELEMQGMVAANKQREHRGESMAYEEGEFMLVSNKIQELIHA